LTLTYGVIQPLALQPIRVKVRVRVGVRVRVRVRVRVGVRVIQSLALLI